MAKPALYSAVAINFGPTDFKYVSWTVGPDCKCMDVSPFTEWSHSGFGYIFDDEINGTEVLCSAAAIL